MGAALIGLGHMGTGIAKSLLRSVHRLRAYNRIAAPAEALLGDGGALARSVAEACQENVVICWKRETGTQPPRTLHRSWQT